MDTPKTLHLPEDPEVALSRELQEELSRVNTIDQLVYVLVNFEHHHGFIVYPHLASADSIGGGSHPWRSYKPVTVEKIINGWHGERLKVGIRVDAGQKSLHTVYWHNGYPENDKRVEMPQQWVSLNLWSKLGELHHRMSMGQAVEYPKDPEEIKPESPLPERPNIVARLRNHLKKLL